MQRTLVNAHTRRPRTHAIRRRASTLVRIRTRHACTRDVHATHAREHTHNHTHTTTTLECDHWRIQWGGCGGCNLLHFPKIVVIRVAVEIDFFSCYFMKQCVFVSVELCCCLNKDHFQSTLSRRGSANVKPGSSFRRRQSSATIYRPRCPPAAGDSCRRH